MSIVKTRKAKPYVFCNMGSFGKASGMLIVQSNFPLEYDSGKDRITSAYLDRMREWDHKHVDQCLLKWKMQGSIESLRDWKEEEVLKFICELMKEDVNKWTGYRITGTVGGNGHPYYSFELFYKDPETSTNLYSGDKAPNVSK